MDSTQRDLCSDYLFEKSAPFNSSNQGFNDSTRFSTFSNEDANDTDLFDSPLSESLESFVDHNRFNALEMSPSGYEGILLDSNNYNSGSECAYSGNESINIENNMLFY
jgi:hypothetical protein